MGKGGDASAVEGEIKEKYNTIRKSSGLTGPQKGRSRGGKKGTGGGNVQLGGGAGAVVI